jgi:polysaccharide export outer membrane protein
LTWGVGLPDNRVMRLCFVVLLILVAMGRGVFAEDYEVGAGDTLRVVVLDQAALSGEFLVDGEGMITYPFLGRVKAAGMTPGEIERKIGTLLGDGYLKRPRLSVTVKDYGSQQITLRGEVAKPGPQSLKTDKSLLALVNSLDLSASAGHEVIVVRPPPPGLMPQDPLGGPVPAPLVESGRIPLPGEVPGAEIFRVSLRELRSGIAERNILLQAGDTVIFPKAAQVYVLGHVGRPGPYRYEEGLTVYQALLQAGGVTDRGSSKGIKVVRLVDGKPKDWKPQMADVLQPEDTIRVPERFF